MTKLFLSVAVFMGGFFPVIAVEAVPPDSRVGEDIRKAEDYSYEFFMDVVSKLRPGSGNSTFISYPVPKAITHDVITKLQNDLGPNYKVREVNMVIPQSPSHSSPKKILKGMSSFFTWPLGHVGVLCSPIDEQCPPPSSTSSIYGWMNVYLADD